MRNVFSDLVVGAQPSLLPVAATPVYGSRVLSRYQPLQQGAIPMVLAVALVTLPVFVQAPWVHAHPVGATAATIPLLSAGILIGLSDDPRRQQLGALLVGFAGSWLGGSLFWGWCRLHPLWHLPLEGIALPLALAGLGSRWRAAGAFYLASLLGTAATDAAMALTGVMSQWPTILSSQGAESLILLKAAATMVLQPANLLVVGGMALALIGLGRWLWNRGGIARISSATLLSTLVVDALFLLLALAAPGLSGVV